jgi:hypothetical protein
LKKPIKKEKVVDKSLDKNNVETVKKEPVKPSKVDKPVVAPKKVEKKTEPTKIIKKHVEHPKIIKKHIEPTKVINKPIVKPKEVIKPVKEVEKVKVVSMPKTSGVMGDSSDDEKPVDKKVLFKLRVKTKTFGDSSSDDEKAQAPNKSAKLPSKMPVPPNSWPKASEFSNKPFISNVQLSKPQIKQVAVLGDSSTDEEELKDEVKNLNGKEDDEVLTEGDSDSGSDDDKNITDNISKINVQPSKARNTIATGAEASRVMFEKQLAEMMRMQNPGYKKTESVEDNNIGGKKSADVRLKPISLEFDHLEVHKPRMSKRHSKMVRVKF